MPRPGRKDFNLSERRHRRNLFGVGKGLRISSRNRKIECRFITGGNIGDRYNICHFSKESTELGYLVAGFICSALVSLVLKVSDKVDYSKYGMLAVNYATCVCALLVTQVGNGVPPFDRDLAFCFSLAFANGFLVLGGMALNQLNVERNGPILQSMFSRLGIIVPTILSISLFGERPSPRQIAGIAIVLAAMAIMNKGSGDSSDEEKPNLWLLFAGLLANGIADSMSKVFEELGSRNLDDCFIGATFFFAGLVCLAVTIVKREPIGKKEIVTGVFLGLPNYFSSLLLLKSLSSVSAYIAYPTYSVGAIFVVILASTILFHEKLSKWKWISCAMILASISLLNF